jgi:RimJ/RimL family protein N-acetyltransferase
MERRWIVEGERVGLTAPEHDEFVARWDVYNDPDLATLLTLPTTGPAATARPPVTRDSREVLWGMVVSGDLKAFDIRSVEDRRLLGECSLSKIVWPRASADVAVIIFDPEDRGRGYGTETTVLLAAYAFDGLGLHRVTLRYLAVNEAVVAAVERTADAMGGRIVGVEHESEWAYGGWQDTVLLEICAGDFPPHPATARLREAPARLELQG